MRSRVVMLVSNACVNDTRVIRAAETLAEKGFDTIVLAKSDDYRTSEEWRNGVHYKRLGKPSFAVRSLPAKAADPIIPPFERLLQYLKEREPALSLLRTLATLIRSLAQPLRRYPSRTSRKVYRTTVRAYYRLNRYAAAFDSTLTLRSRPIRRAHYRARNFFSRLIGRIRAVRKTIRAVGKTFVISRLNFLLCRPLVHARRMRQLFGPDLINLKPDIIHAHDLVTLPAGSAAAKVVGAKLIYDAHELEVHRNTKAGTVDRWLRYYLERKHIRKCDAVITVCDSIADHIAREYSVDRPVVVMNAPDVGRDVVCEASLRSSLGLSSEMPLIVYVGRITVGRGIEQIVEAMQYLPGYHLALVGPKNKPTVEEAQIKAQALRLYDRLHIVDPVPPAIIVPFIRSADVSVIPIQNVCLSYYYCLPNKLLESAMAGLPLVVSNLPELRRFVEVGGGGLVMDETNPHDIARALREAYENKQRLKPDEPRLLHAEAIYGWQKQKDALMKLYDSLGVRAPVPASRSVGPPNEARLSA